MPCAISSRRVPDAVFVIMPLFLPGPVSPLSWTPGGLAAALVFGVAHDGRWRQLCPAPPVTSRLPSGEQGATYGDGREVEPRGSVEDSRGDEADAGAGSDMGERDPRSSCR